MYDGPGVLLGESARDEPPQKLGDGELGPPQLVLGELRDPLDPHELEPVDVEPEGRLELPKLCPPPGRAPAEDEKSATRVNAPAVETVSRRARLIASPR